MEKGIKQLFTITGARGTGKTTLAATYLPPSRIGEVAYIDSEKSANNFRANLKRIGHSDFGLYADLQDRFSDLPQDDDLLDRINRGVAPWVSAEEQSAMIDYYKHIMGLLAELPYNKYSHLVMDTAEKFESGMTAYLDKYGKNFGVRGTSIGSAYGEFWWNGMFPLYLHIFQGIWGRGIDTITLCFHLKNVWENKKLVPGKVQMSGKKILYNVSSLMTWTVNDSRNPNGEPAALVIKERLGQVDQKLVEQDRWGWKQMLPPRIPCATWTEIDRYLSGEYVYNPVSPKATEIYSPAEEDMISEFYNDAQLALMLTDAKIQEQENALAMAQAGLVNANFASTTTTLDFASVATAPNGNKPPSNRAEALRLWRDMGRKVPDLLPKLSGLTDEQITESWQKIVGEVG